MRYGHRRACQRAHGAGVPARARAAEEGLANIEFRPGDATRTGLPDGGFDAVVCVFGVFFAWDIVLGSGYRATVDALSPEQHDRVRDSVLAELRSREITSLRTDVVFGTAARPG